MDEELGRTKTPAKKPPSADDGIGLVPALILLNTVTVLWGTQHAVIKIAVDASESPASLNFVRFGIAALVLSPFTPGLFTEAPLATTSSHGVGAESSPGVVWRAGAELGVWMFLGFAFQSIGLLFTSASRAAFLLYLNIKLVPVFSALFLGRAVSGLTWVSAGVALFGTGLVAYDGAPPNIGDVWCISAAAASAMFILRLEVLAQLCPPRQLNSACLWVTTALSGVWLLGSVAGPFPLSGLKGAAISILETVSAASTAVNGLLDRSLAGVLYLGVVATALCNLGQTLGQREVGAEQAALIFALDPVWAAFFAKVLLDERLGAQGLVGATLILLAAFASQLTKPQRARTEFWFQGTGKRAN